MIIIKDIKECPSHINHKSGSFGNPNLIYSRILIGDSEKGEYTFYADEEWRKKAQTIVDRLIFIFNKVRIRGDVNPNRGFEECPSNLKYMAELIVIDDMVEKDRYIKYIED